MRPVLVATACLLWLAGCETTSTNIADLLKPAATAAPEADATGSATATEAAGASSEPAAAASAPEGETTGTVARTGLFGPPPPEVTPSAKALLGADPSDDLNIGKRHFREGNYGLAERAFRRAAEQHPRDAEAWLGLAASYDRLKRFDLADRAYDQLLRITGPTAPVLNNIGYSHLLRGDYAGARTRLLQAQAKDPSNPYVQTNLQLLADSERTRKAIR